MILSNDILNPRLPGKLIHCFKRLRTVAAIELRQGFNHSYDNVLNFYLDRMDDSIYSGNLNLNRFERLSQVAKQYTEYKIYYSVAHELEIKNELQQEWQYILISDADDVITAYENARSTFHEIVQDWNFCKIREIESLLELEKEELCIMEIGNLEDLIRTTQIQKNS